MAASHRLAIAKATFSAALLNQDTVCAPLSREDIAHFHSSLEATVQRCSPSNVERCKKWLGDNVLPSSSRVKAFGKFLNTISASYGFEVQASKTAQKPNDKVPSCQRKRLHLLYLVNDLLHQTTFRNPQTREGRTSFADSIRPTIVDLVKDAASFDQQTNRKHHDRLNALLQLWREKAYFDSNFSADLASVMASEGKSVPSRARDGVGAKGATASDSNKENWTVPAQHGENGTPWYDLPAACWLPSIEAVMDYRERHPRRRRKGMDPRDVKPLRFNPGPADPKLANAVQQLIRDADSIYNFSLDDAENIKSDYDRMGQKVLIRKIKRERGGRKVRMITGDTYYGWSKDFAEQLYKARRQARERVRRGESEPSERSDSSRSPSPEPVSTLKRRWDSERSSPPPKAPTGPRRSSPPSSSRPTSSDGRYDPPNPQFNNAFPPPPPMQQPYQGYPTPPPPPGQGGYQAPPPPPPTTGWQAPWPPVPPPPNYQQPQQYPQYQQYQAPPPPPNYMQQQQPPPPGGYMQQPPPPPPPFQPFQQPWMAQGQPPMPPGQPPVPQYQQPYGAPNQGQQPWAPSTPRGGPQMGYRGRGRGGNRGGYGYGRGY